MRRVIATVHLPLDIGKLGDLLTKFEEVFPGCECSRVEQGLEIFIIEEKFLMDFKQLRGQLAENFKKITADGDLFEVDIDKDRLWELYLSSFPEGANPIFRERTEHGIEKRESIRPYLSDEQIAMLDTLQKVDVGLLVAVPDYQQRKRHLEWYKTKVMQF